MQEIPWEELVLATLDRDIDDVLVFVGGSSSLFSASNLGC
jgi:hypothetical protein